MALVIVVGTPFDLANHAWQAAASEVGAVLLVQLRLPDPTPRSDCGGEGEGTRLAS